MNNKKANFAHIVAMEAYANRGMLIHYCICLCLMLSSANHKLKLAHLVVRQILSFASIPLTLIFQNKNQPNFLLITCCFLCILSHYFLIYGQTMCRNDTRAQSVIAHPASSWWKSANGVCAEAAGSYRDQTLAVGGNCLIPVGRCDP